VTDTYAFMGGELDAFLPSDSSPIEITTGGTGVFPHDPAFSRCGIQVVGTSYVDTPQFAALTECWTRIKINNGTSTQAVLTSYPIYWLDAGDVPVLRLSHTTGSFGAAETVGLEHLVSSTWTAIGSAISSVPMSTTLQDIVIRWIVNSATGTAELYVGGSLRLTASVDLSAVTSIRKVRVYGGAAGGFNYETRFSQMVVTNFPLVGLVLGTCVPTGAGSTSSWTGTYTSIDEAVLSDADFIYSGTAAQISTFAQTPIPNFTGYVVRAVCVSARAKRGASGPQNIRMALRSAGTNYFSGSDIALGLGYAPVQTIWATDPATSAAWVNTAISSLEPGVKSIT
jgi:hypothetical protein